MAAVGSTGLAVAGLVGILGVGPTPVSADRASLELRVLSYGTFDETELETVRQAVATTLASAGIQIAWRECGNGRPCDDPREGGPYVRVHLLPTLRASNPNVSGDAVRGSNGIAIALIYLPRIEHVLETIRGTARERSQPVSGLTRGDLVGLSIAHEIGHLFGLSHAAAGIMKPELTLDDVIAWRSSRLEFRAEQGARMRLAVQRATSRRQKWDADPSTSPEPHAKKPNPKD